MKTYRVSLLVLSLILAFSLFVGASQRRYSRQWQELIAQADACAVEEDWHGALEALHDLSENWENALPRQKLIASHDDLYAFATALRGAVAAAQEQDSLELRLCLGQLFTAAQAMQEESRLSWGNIM